MKRLMTLLASVVALAASAAADAPPVVKILPAGGKAGAKIALTVYGEPNGHPLMAVVLRFRFDAAKLTVDPMVTAASGWDPPFTNMGAGSVAVASVITVPQASDGPIFTFTVTKTDDSIVPISVETDIAASSFADDKFDVYGFPAGYGTAILPYPVRDLGAPISGSPSVGFDTVAVAAGKALRLLRKDDLSDVNGADGSALNAGISGRPSFGAIDGRAVVAVGTTDGKVAVFDAVNGAAVGAPVTVGTAASSPAITADGAIYVTASDGSHAALVNVSTGAVASLAGAAVRGDPAILYGCAVAVTDAGLTTVRVPGMVPQAFIAATGTWSSPVLDGWSKGVIANGSRLYDIDCVTGNLTEGPFTPTTLSEGFQSGAATLFGGADGALYQYAGGALSATPLLPAAINAQPLALTGKTYAADAAGHIKAGSADALMLGGAPTKAMAATGPTPADGLIVAMPEGVILRLPL